MQNKDIEELFIKHASYSYCNRDVIEFDDFAQAINQAEKELKLEWYIELKNRIESIRDTIIDLQDSCQLDVGIGFHEFYTEISNKIKEL